MNIDQETLVFKAVATQLRADYTGIYITGTKSNATPSSFPAVTIIRSNDYPIGSTFEDIEPMTYEEYEFEIVSNLSSGKELQCRKIAQTIDNVMQSMNYFRTFDQPIATTDGTLARRVTRFNGKTPNI